MHIRVRPILEPRQFTNFHRYLFHIRAGSLTLSTMGWQLWKWEKNLTNFHCYSCGPLPVNPVFPHLSPAGHEHFFLNSNRNLSLFPLPQRVHFIMGKWWRSKWVALPQSRHTSTWLPHLPILYEEAVNPYTANKFNVNRNACINTSDICIFCPVCCYFHNRYGHLSWYHLLLMAWRGLQRNLPYCLGSSFLITSNAQLCRKFTPVLLGSKWLSTDEWMCWVIRMMGGCLSLYWWSPARPTAMFACVFYLKWIT